jgi:hypothetical protein
MLTAIWLHPPEHKTCIHCVGGYYRPDAENPRIDLETDLEIEADLRFDAAIGRRSAN